LAYREGNLFDDAGPKRCHRNPTGFFKNTSERHPAEGGIVSRGRTYMTQSDLQPLFSHPERPYPAVLSVYLNIDQSRLLNQNRRFEQQLRDMILSIRATIHDTAEMERFVTAAHYIEDFVSACEPRTRGLVMFFDGLDRFFWHQQVEVPIHSQARWDHGLFLQPLANILDQFERYGVVLMDRDRLRLFTVFLGEVEEVRPENVGPTTLRRVAKELDHLVQSKQIQHLVLAGASETTSELRSHLPKRLSARVIGAVNITINAVAQDVLSATEPIQEDYERSAETQAVKGVLRGVSRNEKTVAGLGRTLRAVNSDRAWELIYSEGLSSPGFECAKCAALFSVKRKSCAYCGGSVHAVADVVERAVDHALRKGARIEVVTGEAAASLNTVGGIGAFLKARAVSL
jgi:peptide chain release factor subunit 1